MYVLHCVIMYRVCIIINVYLYILFFLYKLNKTCKVRYKCLFTHKIYYIFVCRKLH